MLAFALTFALAPMLLSRALSFADDAAQLPAMLIGELLVGLALGSIVRLYFQAAAIAGSIISLQIGLTSAVVADFSQGGTAPLLSRMIALAAALACMTFSVHHLWIAAMLRSYAIFPIGAWPPAADLARLAVHVAGQALSLGVSLAAPLIVYGLVFNVALGLAARMAPAIQIFFVAQPANLLLGLAVLAGSIGGILLTFARSAADWMQAGWT